MPVCVLPVCVFLAPGIRQFNINFQSVCTFSTNSHKWTHLHYFSNYQPICQCENNCYKQFFCDWLICLSKVCVGRLSTNVSIFVRCKRDALLTARSVFQILIFECMLYFVIQHFTPRMYQTNKEDDFSKCLVQILTVQYVNQCF